MVTELKKTPQEIEASNEQVFRRSKIETAFGALKIEERSGQFVASFAEAKINLVPWMSRTGHTPLIGRGNSEESAVANMFQQMAEGIIAVQKQAGGYLPQGLHQMTENGTFVRTLIAR